MQTIKNKNEQCFLDLVLESTGNIDNTLAMAIANHRSITDIQAIGSEYKVVGQLEPKAVAVFKNYPPATGYTLLEEKKKEGISYWTINKDFIVGV